MNAYKSYCQQNAGVSKTVPVLTVCRTNTLKKILLSHIFTRKKPNVIIVFY